MRRSCKFEGVISQKLEGTWLFYICVIGVSSLIMFLGVCLYRLRLKRTPLIVIMKQLKLIS